MGEVGGLETNKPVGATRLDIAACLRKWKVKAWDLRTGRCDATLTYSVRGQEQKIECSRFPSAE
ncbi:MAG: hypothetical protein HW375_16 [Anaerolineales bacterium]|nr:hypothetical protein [Anaerolineales bacterium]